MTPFSSSVRRERFRCGLLQEFAVVIGREHGRGEPVDPAELSRHARIVASSETANSGVREASRRIKQAFLGTFPERTRLKYFNQRYEPDGETDKLIDDMVSESLAILQPSLTSDTLKLTLEWVAVVPGARGSPVQADTVKNTYYWRLVVADAAVRFAELMLVAPNVTHQNIRELLERLLVRVEQVAGDIQRGSVQECRDLRAALVYRFSTSDLRLIGHHMGRDRPIKQILTNGALISTMDSYQATLRTALRALVGCPDAGNDPQGNESQIEIR